MAKKAKGPSPSEPVVLFVDDDPQALELYELLFRADPFRIVTAPSGLHGLDILRHTECAVVVSDYWMPGMHGVLFLDTVESLHPKTRRVLLTGEPDSEIVLEAKHHKVLTKGMDAALIRRVILRELKRYAE